MIVLSCCSIIVEKIDRDADGKVTKEELRDWIRYVAERSVKELAELKWDTYDKDSDGFISFEEMKVTLFGTDPGITSL